MKSIFEKENNVVAKDITKVGKSEKERAWKEVVGNIGRKEEGKSKVWMTIRRVNTTFWSGK